MPKDTQTVKRTKTLVEMFEELPKAEMEARVSSPYNQGGDCQPDLRFMSGHLADVDRASALREEFLAALREAEPASSTKTP